MTRESLGAIAHRAATADLSEAVDRHATALDGVQRAAREGLEAAPVVEGTGPATRVVLSGDPPEAPAPEEALVAALASGRALEATAAGVRAEDERLAALAFLVAHHQGMKRAG
jgi:hypothetical protein